MSERTVRVTLSAQVAGYVAGMEEAAQATRKTGSAAEKLAQQGEAFQLMGRTAMVAGGVIAAGLGLSTKAAIDWDSAWAGVLKTVDGSDTQLAAVEDGLRGLTAVLPASHDEIAAVAEAAGQLGIKTPEVVEFTKTMIDLGETTNLSSEEAATSLARFMNVMGTSQSEVSGLGSALVELGNNYATTEAEIMAMAMRLAGAGNQIGMSEGQILGLSAALSAVGIESEAGGSAMSKVMIDIASSAEKGGERIAQFAEVAGMSAEDFTAKWQKDPGEALATFVKGLSLAEAQGKSTFGTLEELGITEVRMRDALLRSASAADEFSAAMGTGNTAMEENTALTEEAEKRYETTAAKLDIMKNRVVDAAIVFGENLLPAVEMVAEGIGDFSEMLSGMDGPMNAVIMCGGVITAGILLTGGAALGAIPKIAAYKVALETLGVSSARLKGGLGAVAGVLGPVGIAAALAGGAIAGYEAAARSGEKSTAELKSALTNVKSEYDALTLSVKDQSGVSKVFIGSMIDNLGDLTSILEENSSKTGVWRWLTQDFDDAGIVDRVGDIGVALAEISATDFGQAQSSFAKLVDTYELSEQATINMLDAMPGFRDALIEQADAAGLATDDATLYKLAIGEIKPAAEDAAEGTKTAAEAYVEASDAANALASELMGLLDSYNELNGIGQTSEQQNAALQASFSGLQEYVEQAKAGVEGYELSLDASTEAGASNRAMLAEHAGTVQQNAQAQFELETATLGAEQAAKNYEDRLATGRQQIYDTALALTGNADAAQALTDKIIAMPSDKEIKILLEGASEAAQKVQTLKDTIAGIERNVRIAIETVTKSVGADGNADGGMYAYADGGIEAYANGGFPTGIYKGGAPIHKFAEPETGWEAYISGKPDQRDRNRQIWVESGDRLGMGEVLKALASGATGGGGGGVQVGSVNFTNPNQRQNYRDLNDTLQRLARGR